MLPGPKQCLITVSKLYMLDSVTHTLCFMLHVIELKKLGYRASTWLKKNKAMSFPVSAPTFELSPSSALYLLLSCFLYSLCCVWLPTLLLNAPQRNHTKVWNDNSYNFKGKNSKAINIDWSICIEIWGRYKWWYRLADEAHCMEGECS